MIKLYVGGMSAVLEPGTTASATAEFIGFLGRSTLVAKVAAAYRG